jgi:hypothetical protein
MFEISKTVGLAALILALSLNAFSTQTAFAAATPPVAGTYVYTPVITSVSGCPSEVTTGVGLTTYFSYPGAGKAGAKYHNYTTSSNQTALTVVSYSTNTPASGATTWNFKGKAANYPSGFTWSLSGSTLFTFVDSHSFLTTDTITSDYSSIGYPNCVTSDWATFVYTGQ